MTLKTKSTCTHITDINTNAQVSQLAKGLKQHGLMYRICESVVDIMVTIRYTKTYGFFTDLRH